MIAPLQNHLECLTMRMVYMIPQCQVGSPRQETKAMLTLSLGMPIVLLKGCTWMGSENIKAAALNYFKSRFKERSKAPGPDGFNFNFIKSFWDVIKVDFWNCIQHFESTGSLANGCNPSFIVLTPKKPDPIGFSDYRPISLIGCVYKVISKLLASRLARVINYIISHNQSDFISGRQILDGCLIANEIIQMASLEDQKLLLFKVNFEKAFDVGQSYT
ncbi:cysteine-rich receptor-like protein kinase [Tanacetum coccineum]